MPARAGPAVLDRWKASARFRRGLNGVLVPPDPKRRRGLTDPAGLPLPPELSPRGPAGCRASKRRVVRRRIIAGAVVVVVGAGIGVLFSSGAHPSSRKARHDALVAATAFLRSWQSNDIAALSSQTVGGGAQVSATYAAIDRALDLPSSTVTDAAPLPITFTLGTPTGTVNTMSVPDRIAIAVAGVGTWAYSDTLVVSLHPAPLIVWSPASAVPGLAVGDRIIMQRHLPARAPGSVEMPAPC